MLHRPLVNVLEDELHALSEALLLLALLVAFPHRGHRRLQQGAILRVECIELAWLHLIERRRVRGTLDI